MREQDIERLARDLGAGRARRIEPDRVAARVVARLGSGEQVRHRPTRLARWGLAVAAAVTVVVATDGRVRTDGSAEPTIVAAPVAVTGLDEDGLAEVLDSLSIEVPASEYVGWGIGTMNVDELEALLATMEG